MSMTKTISVARDFSIYPGGRFIEDGPWSGQQFRDEILWPLLKRKDIRIILELDGTKGYGPSFFEEAFGGLVREKNMSKDEIFNRISFVTEDPTLIDDITAFIDRAMGVVTA